MMNTFKLIGFTTCSLLLSSSIAFADGDNSSEAQQSVGLSMGSMGLGLEYSRKLTDSLQIRGGISGGDYEEAEFEVSDIDYEGDIESTAILISLDYLPFKQGWAKDISFSGGIIGFETKYDGYAESRFGSSIIAGGHTFGPSAGNTLRLEFEHDQQVTPYLGVGWGNRIDNTGFAFNANLGLMYIQDPDVELTYSGSLDSTALAALEREKDDIADELGGVTGYASIGVSYSF